MKQDPPPVAPLPCWATTRRKGDRIDLLGPRGERLIVVVDAIREHRVGLSAILPAGWTVAVVRGQPDDPAGEG